jgi:RNA polymerase sigma factor (sigma-70 family)
MTTLARDELLAGDVPGVAVGAVSAEERLAEVAPMVRRMCVARLGPWDGEDAAQEVLLRVWQLQQRPDYDGSPVFGWAAANARFEALSSFRSPARRMVPAGDLGERHWADPSAGPEERAERREAARAAQAQVRELLPRLSMRERQVLLVSEFGMRSNAETGDRLGMSRAAVSVAKQNAIGRMRELVGVTAAGTRAARQAEAYQAVKARRDAARAVGPVAELVGSWPRGVPLPGEVHDAGQAAAGFGWSTERLIGEFGVSAETVRQWRAGQPAESALSEEALSKLVGRAHEARTAAVERAAAAEVRATERGPLPVAGSAMRWPEEVHQAGRAAVREGWSNHDLVRELGVSTDLVTRWRRATAADSTTTEPSSGQVLTAELMQRAHRAVAEVSRRQEEVQACAREFGGTPRGRGQAVPEHVVARAREAARSGWTPGDLERGFGLSRTTARRWIREETQARDDHRPGGDRIDVARADSAQKPREGSRREDSGGAGGGRGKDPLSVARRAVAELPSPQDARAAVAEPEQLHRTPAHGTDADQDVEQDDARVVSAA